MKRACDSSNVRLVRFAEKSPGKLAKDARELCVFRFATFMSFSARPKITPDEVLKKDQIGVATGLAWTAVGGDVLFIEALRVKGKGSLVLTGKSARSCANRHRRRIRMRSRALKSWISCPRTSKNYDLHIHIPEGAIPKDGPSAGITLATALVSVLSRQAHSKRCSDDRGNYFAGKRAPGRWHKRESSRGVSRSSSQDYSADTKPARS